MNTIFNLPMVNNYTCCLALLWLDIILKDIATAPIYFQIDLDINLLDIKCSGKIIQTGTSVHNFYANTLCRNERSRHKCLPPSS